MQFLSGILLATMLHCGLFAASADTTGTPGDTTRGRGEYALVAYVGGGLSYYSTNIGIPDGMSGVRTNRLGVPLTLRVMWHPDHRLRVGFETGWTTLYSYTSRSAGNDGKVYLSAVPLLLVWSMPVTKRLNLFAATGTYLVNSHLEYAGTVDVNTFSLGWMVAGSYVQPLSRNLGLGAELKWMNASETADANFVVQLQLVWKFLRW